MKTKYRDNTVTITGEPDADKLGLSVIASIADEICYLTSLAESRVIQAKQEAYDAKLQTEALRDNWLLKASHRLSGFVAKLKGGN